RAHPQVKPLASRPPATLPQLCMSTLIQKPISLLRSSRRTKPNAINQPKTKLNQPLVRRSKLKVSSKAARPEKVQPQRAQLEVQQQEPPSAGLREMRV